MRRALFRLVAAGAAWHLLVRWTEWWGALPSDPGRVFPGDHLVPVPALDAIRSIVIDAPPEEVFPWFAQMGVGRAGWYSFDMIDNRGIPSAVEIVPEWVVDEPGVSLGEMGGVEFVSADVRAGEHFVMLAETDLLTFSAAYVLDGWGEGATRVVVRVRAGTHRRWLRPLLRHVLGPGDFVMMRRQLDGVKRRVANVLRGDTSGLR